MIGESTAIPMDHQGYEGKSSSNVTSGYDPSPEDEKTIKLVDKLFAKAKQARKPYDHKWPSNYKMFRGKQWPDNRPSYRHSEVINLIFRAIQSEVPILTDGRPKPEFIPQEPTDMELAQVLNDVLDSDWEQGNWLYKLTEMIYDSHFYGTSFGCLKYNPDAAQGLGRIEFDSEDPFYMFPDPAARDVNERCEFFINAEPVQIARLKRDYPDVAQYLKADIMDLQRKEKANVDDQIKYRSPTDNRAIFEGQGFDSEAQDEALKVTLYYKDQAYVEEETKEVGDDGKEKSVFVQKLKYPQGRKVVVVNGVLCENGALEYEDAKFPYQKMVNYILPREFWGMSEVEQLESPQKIFNKLISFSLDVLTLMGNPVWVVDNTSGIDTDNLFNRPGLIIEKEPGSEVRRDEGVQLQPYVLQMIDRMKTWFDDVSGSTDASRGIKPEGVTAASAITALQESTQTRIRQKTRNIDAFTQNFGQQYISRVLQFYDVPRVFRVTNDQNVTKYFKFHIAKHDEMHPVTGQPTGDQYKMAHIRPYQRGDDGQFYEGEEKALQIRGEFDVRVSSGSSLPFEKTRVESQSYALFDRGIIDSEEVLKNIKYPNAEAVITRMADKKAQEQAMQAQGGGGMPPGAGAPPPGPPPA